MRLVSVHVPKVAGISFQRQLTHLFGQRAFWDYNHTDRPDYTPEPAPHHLLKELRTRKPTVIHGHFFLSKYKNIPGLQRAMWFRDPVQRLLSHYYYWLRGPDMEHPNSKALMEGGLSVLEFAQIPELRNVFTRFLDGEPLSELNWVGIFEDYQESIDLFYAMYAVGRNPTEIMPHENLNRAKGGEEYEIETAIVREIQLLNRDDMDLYREARAVHKKLVDRYGNGY